MIFAWIRIGEANAPDRASVDIRPPSDWNYEVANYLLPAGSAISWSQYVMAPDQRYFPRSAYI